MSQSDDLLPPAIAARSRPVADDPGSVTVSCLGVPLALPAALARRCRHLPRTGAPPVARVDAGDADGVAALTSLAVEHTDLLAVHAAVVAGPTGALVVPAPSGAGKSTLTAALLRRGFAYVSDEVLAVDRNTGQVTPFPRPLALHATSWDVVSLPAPRPAAGEEGVVDPADIGRVWTGSVRVTHVVLPARGHRGVTLTSARPADLVAALVPRCFNHYRDPPSTLRTLGVLATSAVGWFATYRDAPTLADTLADAMGVSPAPR